MRRTSAVSDPRLWVAVGLGSLLICALTLAFALVLDHELDRRAALLAPLPTPVQPADDTGRAALAPQEQARIVAPEPERAAEPPDPFLLRNSPQPPAGPALTPIVSSVGCGILILVLGALGSVLLLRGPNVDPPGPG